MRTTLAIDDDVLEAARRLAQARDASLGSVVSELARKGLRSTPMLGQRNRFPVFIVSPEAASITLEAVKRGQDGP